ncbi:hypothetical protein [Clostridium sp. YIM B02551]|uniref:hypothetical protein n=1 Tax=Clostridium sp. YIM B02551 TaxID=2910679 RepID=UPI001EEBCF85|nr:hypothetical protein [Clostridium sp. YIM B02551]
MCPICDDLHETIRIEHPYQYYSIVEQIKTMLQEGILVLTEGNCDFSLIDRNKTFPNDGPYHVFKCGNCECRFGLCVDTYHGSGGSWEVIHN